MPKAQIGEDQLLELVLEAGAEDMTATDANYEIVTDPHAFEAVQKAIEQKGLEPESAEVAYLRRPRP